LAAIRPAGAEDIPRLAALLRGLGYFDVIEAEPPEATLDRVRRSLAAILGRPDHLVLVATEEADAAVGYAAMHWLPCLFLGGSEAFVSELFVHPDARGAGLGGRLLAEAERLARAAGCVRMQLINFRTRESYARRFYAKQGWVERPEAASFRRQLD
jgi:GNAT superfamily N-acetyltransferase